MDYKTTISYYNILSFILICEGLFLGYEVYVNQYSNRAFMTVLFMLMAKISQINLIHYYNLMKNK